MNITIASTECDDPSYKGFVYVKNPGANSPQARYITSDTDGYLLTGFHLWTIYTFKLFIKCPQTAQTKYAFLQAFTGGTGTHSNSIDKGTGTPDPCKCEITFNFIMTPFLSRESCDRIGCYRLSPWKLQLDQYHIDSCGEGVNPSDEDVM